MNEQQKKELANQSVARLHQIRASLLEVDKQEEEALGKLTKSAQETPERLAVEKDFLRTRVELYNEQANILSQLVNDIKPAIDDAEVKALAKDVKLAATLSEKRQQAGSKGQMVSKGICGPCTECVTHFIECVGDCIQCVTNDCLFHPLG